MDLDHRNGSNPMKPLPVAPSHSPRYKSRPPWSRPTGWTECRKVAISWYSLLSVPAWQPCRVPSVSLRAPRPRWCNPKRWQTLRCSCRSCRPQVQNRANPAWKRNTHIGIYPVLLSLQVKHDCHHCSLNRMQNRDCHRISCRNPRTSRYSPQGDG